jgi:hypothetical protein
MATCSKSYPRALLLILALAWIVPSSAGAQGFTTRFYGAIFITVTKDSGVTWKIDTLNLKTYILSATDSASRRHIKDSLLSCVRTSRTIATQYSLQGGGDLSADRTLQLVGDASAPGNSKYYGTNGSGTRGYYDLPSVSAGPQGGIVAFQGATNFSNLCGADSSQVLFNGFLGLLLPTGGGYPLLFDRFSYKTAYGGDAECLNFPPVAVFSQDSCLFRVSVVAAGTTGSRTYYIRVYKYSSASMGALNAVPNTGGTLICSVPIDLFLSRFPPCGPSVNVRVTVYIRRQT